MRNSLRRISTCLFMVLVSTAWIEPCPAQSSVVPSVRELIDDLAMQALHESRRLEEQRKFEEAFNVLQRAITVVQTASPGVNEPTATLLAECGRVFGKGGMPYGSARCYSGAISRSSSLPVAASSASCSRVAAWVI